MIFLLSQEGPAELFSQTEGNIFCLVTLLKNILLLKSHIIKHDTLQ